MIARRSFLGGILGAMAAPAIVRASSLMPGRVWTPNEPKFIVSAFGRIYYDRYELDSAIDALGSMNSLIYRINPEPTPFIAGFERIAKGKGRPILDTVQVYESLPQWSKA